MAAWPKNMDNIKEKYYKALFFLGAIYDWAIGFAFLFFYVPIFSYFDVDYSCHPAFISLSAAFVFVLGFGYYMIYKNMKRNRDLVIMGTMYKIAYAGVIAYYLAIGLTPRPVFTIFGICDFSFAILSIEFLLYMKKQDNIG